MKERSAIPGNILSQRKSKLPTVHAEAMLQAILDGSVNPRQISHVIIPETVEELEEDVFLHCTALTKITILASIKNAHSAFDKCPTLEHVHFGPKADMPFRCFENCHALQMFTVDAESTCLSAVDGVLFSKDGRKLMCYPTGRSAQSYNLPDTVCSIGHSAFRNNTGLKRIHISPSVSNISYHAFSGCQALEEISIPDTTGEIYPSAFDNCIKLRQVQFYHAPNCYVSSGYRELKPGDVFTMAWKYVPFANCVNIEAFRVEPENARYREVDGVLFSKDLEKLYFYPPAKQDQEYTVPNGTLHISNHAFAHAKHLETVHIPSSVTLVREWAFSDCAKLKKLIFDYRPINVGSIRYEGKTNYEAFLQNSPLATIIAHENSCTYQYAVENRLPVTALAAVDDNTLLDKTLPDKWDSIIFQSDTGCVSLEYEKEHYSVSWSCRIPRMYQTDGKSNIYIRHDHDFAELCQSIVNSISSEARMYMHGPDAATLMSDANFRSLFLLILVKEEIRWKEAEAARARWEAKQKEKPQLVTPEKYEDIVIANPPRSFFQNFSFQNMVLRRNGTWQGCASYQTEEGKMISGELNISANDFMLNVSPAFSPRCITGKLLADPKAISITNDSVTLRCKNGTYTFLLASDVAASLREWFDEKKEAFYIISNMSNSVLADYASFPHPFTEQHAKKDADKYRIFRYLGGYIPELFEPFRWNCTDISMQINEEVTDIKFDYYRYRETKDSITYDHDEVCIGFFDDSGIDIHFHLEIRYLGEDIPAEDQAKVNNEMLDNCFWKETIFAPRISVEPFIAKDPFGLQGYYSFCTSANCD